MVLVKNLEAQLGLSLPTVFVAQDLNPDKLWQSYTSTLHTHPPHISLGSVLLQLMKDFFPSFSF